MSSNKPPIPPSDRHPFLTTQVLRKKPNQPKQTNNLPSFKEIHSLLKDLHNKKLKSEFCRAILAECQKKIDPQSSPNHQQIATKLQVSHIIIERLEEFGIQAKMLIQIIKTFNLNIEEITGIIQRILNENSITNEELQIENSSKSNFSSQELQEIQETLNKINSDS